MLLSHRYLCSLLPAILIGLAALMSSPKLQAQEFQSGIAIVTTADGTVEIETPGGAAKALELHQVLELSGQIITTGENSACALALSNGSALLMGPDTRAEFSTFDQRPFDAVKQSLEYEPSVSKVGISVESGSVAVAATRLSPLSEISLSFPFGSVRTNSALGEVTYDGTHLKIVVEEGNMVFLYPEENTREFVAAGQTVEISQQSALQSKPEKRESLEAAADENRTRVAAAKHASERVIYQIEGDGLAIPRPRLITTEKMMEQPSPRPYVYQSN